MLSSIRQQTGFAHLHDLPCWLLHCGPARAVISSYGAQVLSYQPSAGDELLWLSEQAGWNNQAIRGGIPICWPWFGPAQPEHIPEANQHPSHGLARTRHWQLLQQQCTATEAILHLHCLFDRLPQQAAATELQLELRLTSQALQLTLRCAQALPQQAALHSYFRIHQPGQLKVHGLGRPYLDKVQQRPGNDGLQGAQLYGETDRIYQQPTDKLLLQDGEVAVSLQQAGHDSSVLWNPGPVKSKQLSDVADDGYQQFVCVETARLHWQAVPLHLVQRISRR
ncbi:D-hexose-6-phosphate mutarotase [Alkalimonas mucilaginosa]|uniref:Putative glucose-6-phosphate 1-epimerase n=1 Tax=Alkalimonas mucilaginosa TaxID=3057676 RepID=A0ABU7JDQ1_9GAMM|nr:D-hexose-6-phosphate mutarotase [Alkalimonas sp. MEB004]MEE2023737.1 D-hexose-6-phosphate mutarotase [Alkalimonas sp. MEB004]